MATIALLGVGAMGETLLAGLIAAGYAPADLVCADRGPGRGPALEARYGVATSPPAEAVASSDIVLIMVKPQDVAPLLDDIAPHLGAHAIVASIAAGVTTQTLEARLPAGTSVVRAMPNTPARVGAGMTALAPGSSASDAEVEQVAEVLRAVGQVSIVPERYMDAVTAISGSGPAYLFYVVESMIDAAVMLGLPRDIATQLVVQTMYGSAKLLRDSGEHPTVLRENVTSPGGTTAAALRQFEEKGVRAAFSTAMEAARDRSAALADFMRDNSTS